MTHTTTRPDPAPNRRPRHQRRPGTHPMTTPTVAPDGIGQARLQLARWAAHRRQAELQHLTRHQSPPWRPLRRRRRRQLLTAGQADLNRHLALIAALTRHQHHGDHQ